VLVKISAILYVPSIIIDNYAPPACKYTAQTVLLVAVGMRITLLSRKPLVGAAGTSVAAPASAAPVPQIDGITNTGDCVLLAMWLV
jgi:hypothetical protein